MLVKQAWSNSQFHQNTGNYFSSHSDVGRPEPHCLKATSPPELWMTPISLLNHYSTYDEKAIHIFILSFCPAYFLGSWRRSSPHGEPGVPSGGGRTWPTASSAPPCSFASCARPSCPPRCSTWCRSTPPSARRARSRSSPRWCRTWPASASESLSPPVLLHNLIQFIFRFVRRLWEVGCVSQSNITEIEACSLDCEGINCYTPTVSSVRLSAATHFVPTFTLYSVLTSLWILKLFYWLKYAPTVLIKTSKVCWLFNGLHIQEHWIKRFRHCTFGNHKTYVIIILGLFCGGGRSIQIFNFKGALCNFFTGL